MFWILFPLNFCSSSFSFIYSFFCVISAYQTNVFDFGWIELRGFGKNAYNIVWRIMVPVGWLQNWWLNCWNAHFSVVKLFEWISIFQKRIWLLRKLIWLFHYYINTLNRQHFFGSTTSCLYPSNCNDLYFWICLKSRRIRKKKR